MEDLKESMDAQMEVFLQTDTKVFIDDLFKTLDSQSYVNTPPPVRSKADAEASTATSEGAIGEKQVFTLHSSTV